jgi:hypothetical protein
MDSKMVNFPCLVIAVNSKGFICVDITLSAVKVSTLSAVIAHTATIDIPNPVCLLKRVVHFSVV